MNNDREGMIYVTQEAWVRLNAERDAQQTAIEAAIAELRRAPDEKNTFDGFLRIQKAVGILTGGLPAELLARRERERAQITAALSLLVEIEEQIANTPNGSIYRFRAAMGYLRAALGEGVARTKVKELKEQ